jgi:hypothetical protein
MNYEATPNLSPKPAYLIKGQGTKARAHLWTGTDTVCRMWSTGGLSKSKYSVCSDSGGRKTCHMCLAGGAPRAPASAKPATGKEKRLLERIVGQCGGTAACLRAELSGERDGDCLWHGSYPVTASIEDLVRVCQEWLDWERQVRNAQRILKENESEEASFYIDDDVPF